MFHARPGVAWVRRLRIIRRYGVMCPALHSQHVVLKGARLNCVGRQFDTLEFILRDRVKEIGLRRNMRSEEDQQPPGFLFCPFDYAERAGQGRECLPGSAPC